MPSQARQPRSFPRPHSRRSFVRWTAAAGASATVTLAGCRSKRQAQPPLAAGVPKAGGVYKLSQPKDPPSLDPQQSSTSTTMTVAGATMSRLFRYQSDPDPRVAANHTIENDLGLSAESPDAITWTVKLRSNAKFQDVAPVNGHPVTAEDVKASFVRALTLTTNPGRGALNMMDSSKIEAPTADTVVFKLQYPYASFPNTLASPILSWILPREAAAGGYDPTKTVIGSGPFLFDSFTPDVSINFKKNPTWFEPGRPYVDGVQIANIPDPSRAQAEFRAGQLNEVIVTYNDLQTVQQGSPQAAVVTSDYGGDNFYYFQLGDPASPFLDVRIRRALSMAIDRDSLGRAIFGKYQMSFYAPPTLGNWALHLEQLPPDTAKYYHQDVQAAKQLFGQAAGSNLHARIVYIMNGGFEVDQKPMTEGIRNMLQALPWTLDVGTADVIKDFIGGGKGWNYGHLPLGMIFDAGISGYSSADEYLYNYYHSQSPRNLDNLSDLTLDGMIDKARRTIDREEQRKVYLDVQKYIADKVYSIGGLPAAYRYTLVQPTVYNYGFSFENGNFGVAWSHLWLTQ